MDKGKWINDDTKRRVGEWVRVTLVANVNDIDQYSGDTIGELQVHLATDITRSLMHSLLCDVEVTDVRLGGLCEPIEYQPMFDRQGGL